MRLLCVIIFLSFILATIGILRWTDSFAPSREGINSIVITDRNGVPLREVLSRDEARHQWVRLDQISPRLIDATIVAEDKRFRRHAGVDPIAIVRALVSNIFAGRVVSGGSTITQQLARMLNPKPRTIISKIREAAYALGLEIVLSKNEILEQYLNRAPYGNQLIGCEAASRMYFDKPARDLSIAEAAYLAVLPRAPGAINPYRRRRALEDRHRRLLDRLHTAKTAPKDMRDIAFAHPVRALPKRWAFAAPHFVEMLPPIGNAGVVRTSLDIRVQSEVERIVHNQLAALERSNVTNAAVAVVHNPTGEIRTLVGSHDYFDESANGQVNGATALRQPGSTLKPFLYALALENGNTASSILPDIPVTFPTTHGDYAPQNYDLTFRGPVRIRTALGNSLNVPAVYLLSQLGVHTFASLLHELGFDSLDEEPQHYGLGLTLGNGEVTLMELAGAYATLARNGVYLPLSTFPQSAAPRGKELFSRETAYLIADILSDNETRRMSFGEDTPLTLPFTVAAKTGTTKNFRDNWTVGFTKDYTVAVWVGNFDGTPMKGVSGITGAGPIFHAVMLALAEVEEPAWLDRPASIVVQSVCPLSGDTPNDQCTTTIDELFAGESAPKTPCSFHTQRVIDTRNELLASEACAPQWTTTRSFIDMPPRYSDWAMTHGIPLPPERYSPRCPPPMTAHDIAHAPRIMHPRNNSVYALDPYIPRRLQTLTMNAAAEGPLTWFIDDDEIARTTPPHRLSWQLAEGIHRIRVASASDALHDEITIIVHR